MGCDTSENSPETVSRRRVGLRGIAGCLLHVCGALFLVLVLGGVLCLLGFQWWAHRDTRQVGAPVSEIVLVRKGDSLRAIAARLERQGVAGPARLVVVLALWQKTDRRLMPGRYVFQPGTPPSVVLERLAKGPDIPTVRVTLPEGWRGERMAQRLVASGAIADADGFLACLRDSSLLQSFGIEASTAEGFLFPDTYRFEKPTAPADVARRLVERFFDVVRDLKLQPGLNSPHAYGLTFLQYLTLASIIEREARDAGEMPRISAVFHNRLKKGMRLDSCATVRHALGKWDGPLTVSDLKVDSPYNTYVHKGLPPGPICNPGRSAIDAAFRPDGSDFLYYVYRGDGKHAFSKSLKEHERLRRKYRKEWAFSASKGSDQERP